MIEKEILKIVGDPTDDGSQLNKLADQFRSGRDLEDIIVLLDSDRTDLVSCGVWILGELNFAIYDSEEIVSRLHHLVVHQDAAVRIQAFGALFPALDPQSEATQEILFRLRSDPNEGVRLSAEAAAKQWMVTTKID